MYALSQCRRFTSNGVQRAKVPAKAPKRITTQSPFHASITRLYSSKTPINPIVVKSKGTEKMANVARGTLRLTPIATGHLD